MKVGDLVRLYKIEDFEGMFRWWWARNLHKERGIIIEKWAGSDIYKVCWFSSGKVTAHKKTTLILISNS